MRCDFFKKINFSDFFHFKKTKNKPIQQTIKSTTLSPDNSYKIIEKITQEDSKIDPTLLVFPELCDKDGDIDILRHKKWESYPYDPFATSFKDPMIWFVIVLQIIAIGLQLYELHIYA